MREDLLRYVNAPEYSCLLMGQAGLDGDMERDAVNIASLILNCDQKQLPRHPDFMLVDSNKEKSIGVDVIDEVISKAQTVPAIADKIVVLIRQFNKCTEQAQNMLLKLIEESQSVLIIGTCYQDNILETIKSRCSVFQYKPYTKELFNKYCVENDLHEDSSLLFYLTNGCPGLINEDPEVLNCFKEVANVINTGNESQLLTTLHLLEEKDKDNFYIKYPNHVTPLLRMMSNLYLQKRLQYPKSDNYNTICKLLNDNLLSCSKVSYTKDNFFYLIAQIITA